MEPDYEEANNFINDVFGRVTAMSALRCAIDTGLLDTIPLNDDISLSSMSTQVGCPAETLRRILLPLTAMGIIDNPAAGTYKHTTLSAAMRDKNVQGYFTFGWDHIMPSFNNLHDWFAQNQWREPADTRDCAFAMNHRGQGLFEHLVRNPGIATNFNMMNEHMQFPVTGICPFDKLVSNGKLVDVGGGKGQACVEILREYPKLRNRIILQDKADNLPEVPTELHSSLEMMPYDFFKPQPVKGAAVYHIRRILCDWPDKDCRLMLRNQAMAMNSDSRLLVAGFIVPEHGCHPLIAGMDLSTLIYAGKERTMEQFRDLLSRSGLQIVKVWSDDEGLVSIIESKRIENAML